MKKKVVDGLMSNIRGTHRVCWSFLFRPVHFSSHPVPALPPPSLTLPVTRVYRATNDRLSKLINICHLSLSLFVPLCVSPSHSLSFCLSLSHSHYLSVSYSLILIHIFCLSLCICLSPSLTCTESLFRRIWYYLYLCICMSLSLCVFLSVSLSRQRFVPRTYSILKPAISSSLIALSLPATLDRKVSLFVLIERNLSFYRQDLMNDERAQYDGQLRLDSVGKKEVE